MLKCIFCTTFTVVFALSPTYVLGQSSTPPSVTEAMDLAKAAVEVANRAAVAAKDARDVADRALKAADDALQASKKDKPADSDIADAVQALLPQLHLSPLEHFGRSIAVSVSMAEQPAQIQVGSDFVPTPQGYLTKGSLAITPSEFFTTPSDISAEATGFTDAGGQLDNATKGAICHDEFAFVLARCLIRSRKRDVVYRALSGLSATLSYSENLRVKSNTLIEAGSAAASHNNQWSGSVGFTATGMFVNGNDWLSAVKAAAAYKGDWTTKYREDPGQTNVGTTISRELLRVMAERCDVSKSGIYVSDNVNLVNLFTRSCIKRIAGPYGLRAWAASAIPDVTYQLQTQFDFVKNGSTFIPYAGLQPSLWTVSAKWDLSKYLAPAKNRLAALAAIKAAYDKEKKDTEELGYPIDSRPAKAQVLNKQVVAP